MAYFSHPLLITSFPSYVQRQKQLQDYKAIGDQVLNFDEFVVSIWVGKSIFFLPQGESLLLGDLQYNSFITLFVLRHCYNVSRPTNFPVAIYVQLYILVHCGNFNFNTWLICSRFSACPRSPDTLLHCCCRDDKKMSRAHLFFSHFRRFVAGPNTLQ